MKFLGFLPPRRLVDLVRASKISLGSVEVAGVPAVLLGVSGIILATGVARALCEGIHVLPESLRETRLLIESARSRNEPRSLPENITKKP
ncbi:MAG TPA: hypothetical protein VGZ00_11490 [Candidatus Baltobacteraceae bacterium]|jgi:hypothetical protein|nr:hypothetical protein [Candidatus Baltobacteraceae bacterium]